LHVRCQLARRTFERVEVKTPRSAREIEIDDGLQRLLTVWRLRSGYCGPTDFVVTTESGRPLDQRAAECRLDVIVGRAGLDVEGLPRVTPHQLRYALGSLVLDVGESVPRVSRLMGHANEAITLSVYAHEIERRDGGEKTRATMRAAFGRNPRTAVSDQTQGAAKIHGPR
jgi:integrase